MSACFPVRKILATTKVVFRLSQNARSVILRHRREALRRAEDVNRVALGNEGRKSPAWFQIKASATEQAEITALRELGIGPDVLTSSARQDVLVSILAERDEEPVSDDPAADDLQSPLESVPTGEPDASDIAVDALERSDRGQAAGDSDTLRAFEFAVGPDTANPPPLALIEREQIPQKWLRLDVDLGTLRIELAQNTEAINSAIASFNAEMQNRIERTIDAWLVDTDARTGGSLWAFPGGRGMQSRTITPADVVAWDQALAGLRNNRRIARPTILPVVEYENLEDPLRPSERTVRIILANESDLLDAKTAAARETDASLYQVEISVEFEPNLHRPIRLDRIAPSYRYNQYLSYDSLGINCGIRRRRLIDTNVLETTSLPTYYQPSIEQFDISPQPEFEKLGGADGGIDVLRGLVTAFDAWLTDLEEAKPYERSLDPVADATDYAREKQQFEGVDLRGWRYERDAIARGLAIIEKAVEAKSAGKSVNHPEVVPLTAWRFMNQTFAEFWRTKSREVKSWRLFQVAFILSQLPAIVSRLDCWKPDAARTAADDREAALLYFSTGGGKSESFFGLLVFCLAFDRLRGKERGITALVRYPLRLLTSQQAQRLSQVLAAAYKIMWRWKDRGFDLKGNGFEIGFWVGGNNTPNNRSVRGFSDIPVLDDDWDEVGARRGDYPIYLQRWGRFSTCPFCRGTLAGVGGKRVSSVGLRRSREGLPSEERLAHLCFNKECDWNRRHEARRRPYPLPIHIMDSDIYAYAPSVLLGTVDKLALIGQSPHTLVRVLGMFGFPAWHHPTSGRFVSPWTREQFRRGPTAYGCEEVFPFYSEGKKLFFDPYPLLEIQDEAHLLDESLGTFSGLFETTFHHALRVLAPLLGDQVVTEGGARGHLGSWLHPRPFPNRLVK